MSLTELEGEDKNDLPVVHITIAKVKAEPEPGTEEEPAAEGETGNEEK